MAALGFSSPHMLPHSPIGLYSRIIPFSSVKRGEVASLHLPTNRTNQTLELRTRTGVSFFSFFEVKDRGAENLKQELLEAIAPVDRGANVTAEDQLRIDQIARKLEAINKVKEPLNSALLNGKWELLYTTSTSILQNERPKFLRPNG